MTKRPEKRRPARESHGKDKKPLNKAWEDAEAMIDGVKDEPLLVSEEVDPGKIATALFIRANAEKTPIIGVRAVADYLGYSMRTVHSWRAEFPDFPVESDGVSCVWRATKEDLDTWRDKHIDLFRYRKERLDEAERHRKQLSNRRRWS